MPLKIPVVSASCVFSLGRMLSCKFLIPLASSCTRIIRFRMVQNSVISISSVGFGGIPYSRIRFCKMSFALFTIRRNRFGSQPSLLMDWLTLSCISVCLISSILASSIPDTSAMSAAISSALGLFLPIFFVGRYTLFLSNTFRCCSGFSIWRLIRFV